MEDSFRECKRLFITVVTCVHSELIDQLKLVGLAMQHYLAEPVRASFRTLALLRTSFRLTFEFHPEQHTSQPSNNKQSKVAQLTPAPIVSENSPIICDKLAVGSPPVASRSCASSSLRMPNILALSCSDLDIISSLSALACTSW